MIPIESIARGDALSHENSRQLRFDANIVERLPRRPRIIIASNDSVLFPARENILELHDELRLGLLAYGQTTKKPNKKYSKPRADANAADGIPFLRFLNCIILIAIVVIIIALI